jgi:hypothetical protein
MVGMMIAMATGMLSSLLIGTLLGVWIGKMFVATEVAMLIGMIIGFWTGRPIHLIAAIDGLLAGLMGGMMGAMLGVMVVKEAPIITFAFVFLSVTFSNLLLMFLIRKEASTSSSTQKGSFLFHPYYIRFAISLLVVLIILLSCAVYFQPTLFIQPVHPHHH